MITQVSSARQYGAILLIVAVLAAAAASFIAPRQIAEAAPLSQSVLCAPNVCSGSDATDSMQDVELYNAGIRTSPIIAVRNLQDDNGDANRQLLEIADQDNHTQQQVTVGVYITPDIRAAILTTPNYSLPLQFVNRTCNTGGNPRWTITISNGNDSSNSTQLAPQYRYASSGAAGAPARTFCDTQNPVEFNLAQYPTHFVPYNGGVLYYARIKINLDNFTNNNNQDNRNVLFQMRLTDVCNGTPDCRQYLALMAVSGSEGDNRNFALSGTRQYKKVTTDRNEYRNDPGQYEWFSPTNTGVQSGATDTQRLVRRYVEFGLPCEVATGSQTRQIYLYDINDGDNDNDDWHGWVGGRDLVGVVIQRYDPNQGWVDISPAEVTAISGTRAQHNSSGPYENGGHVAAAHVPAATNSVREQNHNLYTVDGSPRPSYVIIPTGDDHVETRISLNMAAQTRYRMAITPDAGRNFVAVGLPSDQIYGLVGCDTGSVSPQLTVNPSTTVESGQSIRATFGLASTATIPAQARTIARAWYETGTNDSFDAGDRQIGTVRDQSYDTANPGVPTTVYTRDILADAAQGSRICISWQIVSIVEPTVEAVTTVVTRCVRVTQTPYVHVLGNDVRVGSSFLGGTGNLTSDVYGRVTTTGASWVEYAITAPGTVEGLASQSGALNGSSTPQSSWSALTFANTTSAPVCPTNFGCFTAPNQLGIIPNVAAAVASARDNGAAINRTVGASFAVSSLAPEFDLAAFSGSVAISSTGTITIDNDIVYRNTGLASAGDIPQLVLVGRDINIAPNVRRVDAWLIASGTVTTCSGVAQSRLLADCAGGLTINGPIMAQQLQLNRSGRNTGQPSDPAETINLRGDAYIWANRVASGTGRWQTVYTTELPPRY